MEGRCSRNSTSYFNNRIPQLHRVHLASDLHLGAPNASESRTRELRFIEWLENAAEGKGRAKSGPATEIHLVGDVFDFWFEYKHAVPKGGVRLLGAIARIADSGIPIHYHVGNHDLWTFGYFEEELGVTLHREPIVREYDGVRCMIGHGDGIGPGDAGYKRLKGVFTNPILQWAYRWVHPDIGIALAEYLSRNSRARKGHLDRLAGDREEAEAAHTGSHRNVPAKPRSPAGLIRSVRLPGTRTSQPSATERSRIAAPSLPARCARRSLQSRQVRQSGRLPAVSAPTSMPKSERNLRPSSETMPMPSSMWMKPCRCSASAMATPSRPAR